ncbi:hypothetical protein D3C76_1779660 [compost metagenome]
MKVDEPVPYPNTIDINGYGNTDFNKGIKSGRYAFPIIHLYELKLPLDLETLKSEFDFSSPQSYLYLDSNIKLKEILKNKEYIKLF